MTDNNSPDDTDEPPTATATYTVPLGAVARAAEQIDAGADRETAATQLHDEIAPTLEYQTPAGDDAVAEVLARAERRAASDD